MPPNTSSTIMTNTSPASTTSDIIHEDDHDFILVKDDHKGSDGPGTVPTNTEDEEGSADLQPPDKSYTPGYDYIGEDPTREERAHEDNMFTSTPEEVPTSTVQSLHTNISTTKPATTSRTQYNDYLTTSPVLQKPTSSYEPHTTPNPTVPHLNTQSPQATVPTVKILRKASQTPNSPNKGNAPKAVRQKPETATTTDDYGSMNARDPISRNAFWKVGNWSDVRMQT